MKQKLQFINLDNRLNNLDHGLQILGLEVYIHGHERLGNIGQFLNGVIYFNSFIYYISKMSLNWQLLCAQQKKGLVGSLIRPTMRSEKV